MKINCAINLLYSFLILAISIKQLFVKVLETRINTIKYLKTVKFKQISCKIQV
jgi:hypothetical protein